MVDDIDEGILGLAAGIVRLVAYDARWSKLYEQEAAKIRLACAGRILDVQHIGSTSIPGIKAKPILDMMIGIENLNAGPLLASLLEPLGYEFVPHAGVPDDHIFGKGAPRTHLVHVVEHTGSTWSCNIRFREALRSNGALVKEYEEIKLQLAAEHADNRAVYTDKKGAFIARVLKPTR